MAGHPERPFANFELIPAGPDQQSVLANLLELYAYDFSEFHEIELGADGRFGYKHLPLYWREPDRHPFLVKVDVNLAGLVLVNRGPELSGDNTVWDMAEFFIMRRYRRRGIGTCVAHEVWRQFPGRWEIRVMEANHSAHSFWAQAISAFAGEMILSSRIEHRGNVWQVFTFESQPAPYIHAPKRNYRFDPLEAVTEQQPQNDDNEQ
jgi:predicted acetyltransferase